MRVFEFIVREDGGDRVIPFPSSHFCIGSSASCEVRLDASLVRPRHAEIFAEGDQWFIRDVAGSDNVLVDGLRTLEGMIGDGALLKVGKVELAVCVRAPEPTQSGRELGADSIAPDDATRVSGPRLRNVGLTAGEIVDRRYRVVSRIATGGMGEVYRAEHIELGKPVALKVMLTDLSRDTEFVARFKREAIASSRIGQQNIVDISDFGRTEDGRFYFVMELIDGKTLAKHLRTEGAFTPLRTVHVGLQAARALAAAHAQGIIHRDLKPENVMLVQRPGQPDFVKVLDFGVAKVTSATGTAGHTAIGMIVGTPQYMSPEQASGLGVDARSDIYALGLILHELLSGQPTFSGDTPPALMAMQMSSDPPPLRSPRPVPASLEDLVFQMLAKQPEHRPQSMDEVVQRLDETASAPTPAVTAAARLAAITQPASAVETRATPSLLPVDVTGFSPAARTVTGDVPAHGARTVTGEVPVDDEPPGAPTTDLRGLRPAPTPARTRADTSRDAEPLPELDEAAIRPSRAPLIVVGLLTLTALGAGGTWVLLDSEGGAVTATPRPLPEAPKPDAPTPDASPTPEVPTLVRVDVTSKPGRAEVYEGDVLLGTTPLKLQRPAGQLVELKFELKGYKLVVRKLRFESDNAIEIELDKERKVPPPKKNTGLKENPYGEELKELPE